jgi:hypothetical protein
MCGWHLDYALEACSLDYSNILLVAASVVDALMFNDVGLFGLSISLL